MGTAIKAVGIAAVAGLIGLTIYGYAVDMAPPPAPHSLPVVLNGQ